MNPYTVEVDNNGCEKCGTGRTWVVVYHAGLPDEIGDSCSYGNPDEPEHLADALNEAYERGMARCAVDARISEPENLA